MRKKKIGIKDKNGKEICEGDVVNINGDIMYIEYFPCIKGYSTTRGIYSMQYGLTEKGAMKEGNLYEIEIIGNIGNRRKEKTQ